MKLTRRKYEDPAYLDALAYLSEDERVGALGLCNFDTEHMERVVKSGVQVHSNQVQASLRMSVLSIVPDLIRSSFL